MQRSKIILVSFLLFLLAVTGWVARYDTGNALSNQAKKVSVIVYGSNKDRWNTLERGIKVALAEENAEITFVTTSDEASENEQNRLIEKEIQNGADVLIVAVAQGQKQKDFLIEISKKLPIVLVESGVGTDDDNENKSDAEIKCIKGKDYKMGMELAKKLCEQEKPIVKIAVVGKENQRDSTKQRLKGFVEQTESQNFNMVYWEQKDENISPQVFIQNNLTRMAVDIIVAFDNRDVEGIVDAGTNLNKDVKIYGIANSEKAVYYLDKGIISALAYQDEYSMGYIASKAVITGNYDFIDKNADNIEFKVVTSNEVYDEENQKLLFPIVK